MWIQLKGTTHSQDMDINWEWVMTLCISFTLEHCQVYDTVFQTNYQTYSLFHYNRHHSSSNWPHTSPSQIFRSDGLGAFKCRRKMTRFLGWFLLVWNIISCPSWFHSFDFVRKSIGETNICIWYVYFYLYIYMCVCLYIYMCVCVSIIYIL